MEHFIVFEEGIIFFLGRLTVKMLLLPCYQAPTCLPVVKGKLLQSLLLPPLLAGEAAALVDHLPKCLPVARQTLGGARLAGVAFLLVAELLLPWYVVHQHG